MPTYTDDADKTHVWTTDPVTPPPGFGKPTRKVGDAAKYKWKPGAAECFRRYDGSQCRVSCVVFCKSDGKTILYGVRFPDGGAGRFKGHELTGV